MLTFNNMNESFENAIKYMNVWIFSWKLAQNYLIS